MEQLTSGNFQLSYEQLYPNADEASTQAASTKEWWQQYPQLAVLAVTAITLLSGCTPDNINSNYPPPESLNIPRYMQNDTIESTVLTVALGTLVFVSIVSLTSYGVIHNWHHVERIIRKQFGLRRDIDWYTDSKD